jgi:hypothetical protein
MSDRQRTARRRPGTRQRFPALSSCLLVASVADLCIHSGKIGGPRLPRAARYATGVHGLGTADKADRPSGDGHRWPNDAGRPFTSDLSGQDFWTLLQAGYAPLGMVMGTCDLLQDLDQPARRVAGRAAAHVHRRRAHGDRDVVSRGVGWLGKLVETVIWLWPRGRVAAQPLRPRSAVPRRAWPAPATRVRRRCAR